MYTALRKDLGLSQTEFADFLGTTRTTLAMTEVGRRDLPLQPFHRFAMLNQFVNHTEPLLLPREEELYYFHDQVESEFNSARRRLAAINSEILESEGKLEQMQKDFETGLKRLRAFKFILDDPLYTDDQEIFADKKISYTLDLLKENGSICQSLLRDRMTLLEAEEKILKKRVKELGSIMKQNKKASPISKVSIEKINTDPSSNA